MPPLNPKFGGPAHHLLNPVVNSAQVCSQRAVAYELPSAAVTERFTSNRDQPKRVYRKAQNRPVVPQTAEPFKNIPAQQN